MKTITQLLLLTLASVSLANCQSLGKILRSYGYSELRPASTLLEPGTVVVIKSVSPFQGSLICTQKESLGNVTPQDSTAANQSLVQKISTDLKLEGDYLDQIKADVHYKQVRTVTMNLSNVKVFELSDTQVRSGVRNRVKDCQDSIDARRAENQKFRVTLVKSVLQADVVYTVDFTSDVTLDASAKQEVLKGLALKLGVTNGVATTDTISGKQLFWGVIDDEFLSRIALGKSAENEKLLRIPNANYSILQAVEHVRFEGK